MSLFRLLRTKASPPPAPAISGIPHTRVTIVDGVPQEDFVERLGSRYVIRHGLDLDREPLIEVYQQQSGWQTVEFNAGVFASNAAWVVVPSVGTYRVIIY